MEFRVALTGDFLNAKGESAYGDIGLSLLEAKPWISHGFLLAHAPHAGDSTYWDRFYSLEVTPRDIAGVNGLVVLRPWVKRSAFSEGSDNLVVIGRSGAGYDKIDVQACTDNDVALFNAPGALNHSTASSALLFMLALAKRLPEQDRITRTGEWNLQENTLGSEIEGRTLGIIGLGPSGRELARLVAPFRMNLIAFSPHADPAQAAALAVRLTTLEDLLRQSDFVSLHCRLTPETRGLLSAQRLALLKRTAYLINVARGALVDQAALVEALREGRIAGAGLDVYAVEPLPRDDPLTKLENIILTPHWSASTADVWIATGRAMANGMLRASCGLVPDDVVNKEVLDRPRFRKKLARFTENRET